MLQITSAHPLSVSFLSNLQAHMQALRHIISVWQLKQHLIMYIYNKYFELKTRGAPMGRPKLNLLASNGVHICHAFSITLNARVTPGCTTQKYECIRVLNTNQEAVPKHPHSFESWQLHGKVH